MTPFEQLTADIFANPDFTERAGINGKEIPVIASEISEEERLTRFGVDDGVSFFLRVQKIHAVGIRRNDKVLFRGETYKVDKISLDSAALSYSLDLKSVSSR